MQRWGHSRQGKPRFFCTACRKTATPQRNDVEKRNDLQDLRGWLLGKESLSQIASKAKITRQGLWKRFHEVIDLAGKEPILPDMIKVRILIVDGTYIHGHVLCALIAIDENDKLYWKFAPYESYNAWCDFLSSFVEPDIIVMDGQKGLFAAARTLWPKVSIQRCQFHLIAFAVQYTGRKPREAIAIELQQLLYSLKYAKDHPGKDAWLDSYLAWEKKYSSFFSARDKRGVFVHSRMRSARLIVRRALPYLFTFLDHPEAPNTTNLVEGWVNGAIAEVLRWHRGIRLHEKKALATTVLTNLKRQKNKEVSVIKKLRKADRARRARVFIRRNARKKPAASDKGNLRLMV
ncbi:MAG: hypothetical protein QOE22_40 [Candidatus Parcubacteria bacterium]|jgi:hypothetical protein|nr:hypothetical protein [Candidatus Parcubacteria bacterium]